MQRIDDKIEEIVDYIINKPVDQITLDDYTILRDVQSKKKSDAEYKQRMEQLMAMAVPCFGSAK